MHANNLRTRSRCHCWGSNWFLPTFPVLSFVFFLFSCIISYSVFMAVQHDKDGYVPFISDTGAQRPESCIFGQMLNITAVVLGLTAYFRSKQVEATLEHLSQTEDVVECCGCHVLSLNSCFFGILSALGMSIVGNFQSKDVTLVPHFLGAGMAFLLGMVYIWMQTALALRLRMLEGRRWLPFVKLIVCCLASLAILGFMISGVLLNTNKNEEMEKPYRNATAVFEWITAAFMALYFITFIWDFKSHTAVSPRVIYSQVSSVEDVRSQIHTNPVAIETTEQTSNGQSTAANQIT